MREIHDVAIAGYGPVGAVLANLLTSVGLSVVILEREASIFHQPRAGHFDGEVMRVFQSIGVADAMAKKAHVNIGMQFRNGNDELILDWPRPQEIGPEGWHASYRFHQPDLEAVLRESIADKPEVDVRLRHDVVSATDKGDHVEIGFRNLDSDETGTIRAKYVVGCDGARSTIRRAMGVELEDLKSHEQWLIVDLRLKQDRPDLPLATIQWCDPSRPMTMAGMIGGRRRWEIMLLPGEKPEEIAKPETWWPILSRWVKPEEAHVDRAVIYTFHSVIADQWRKGRMMLAGDSCHQTPPFMGQGMCAGIRDTANLYWKLKAVIDGTASDTLLDTYQSERIPHVRTFIETAVRLGGLVHVIDPVAAEERDARLRNAPEFMVTPAPPLGDGLQGNAPAPAGLRAHQILLADGRKLDDLAQHRFYVLARSGLAQEARTRLDALGVSVFDDSDPSIAAYLDEIGTDAVIIRPDRYILATATTAQELEERLSDMPSSQRIAA